jgi:hypothetical protein
MRGGGVRRVSVRPVLRRLVIAPWLAVVVAVGATACGDGEPGETERAAGIYSAVVRAAVGDEPFVGLADPLRLVVWIYPLEDRSIELAVQVKVLEQLEDFATVRFVDAFDEAVDGNGPDRPVLEDGIAVGLGPVGESPRPQIDAAIHGVGADAEMVIFTVQRSGQSWRAVSEGDG